MTEQEVQFFGKASWHIEGSHRLLAMTKSTRLTRRILEEVLSPRSQMFGDASRIVHSSSTSSDLRETSLVR
jgi:hypothetical protein